MTIANIIYEPPDGEDSCCFGLIVMCLSEGVVV